MRLSKLLVHIREQVLPVFFTVLWLLMSFTFKVLFIVPFMIGNSINIHPVLITNELHGGDLLEKPILAKIARKFLAFYGTRRSITVVRFDVLTAVNIQVEVFRVVTWRHNLQLTSLPGSRESDDISPYSDPHESILHPSTRYFNIHLNVAFPSPPKSYVWCLPIRFSE
jgi:hypothetical protein